MAKKKQREELPAFGPTGRARYRWKAWADGRVHLLRSGEDYTSVKALRTAANMHATRHDLVASISEVREDAVAIVIGPPGTEKLPPAPAGEVCDYGWENYEPGVEHVLIEGPDYFDLSRARSALIRWAARRDLRARTRALSGAFAFVLEPVAVPA